ncbi:hypothetical protein LFX15_02885 [Leptospira levettii]|uniref:LIC20153 family lipoprotein n=1 Tax=Leptospira levettii TaxID=2023178 RepID=UPI001EEA8021|nr:hypothetical protein [Leptospira levettii]MCG6147223.1 hypothetical protein [Leptospira levettii]
MNFLATKFKTLLLLALFGGLTFQCEKKEDNQDTVTVAALAAIFSSAGDCTVNAPPRASINTFTTAITANGSGTISQTGTVPVVAHKNAALKLTAKNTTAVAFSGGSAFLIVYQSSSCPLTTSTTSGFTPTSLSASSEFTNSYLLSNSGTITFNTAGDYYIFIYAIPSRGQTANLSYTVTNL